MKTKKNWSDGEDLFLKNHYDEMSIKQLAEYLNRNIGSVSSRAKLLGFPPKRKIYKNDSNTHKTCRNCFQVYPKTKDYFWSRGRALSARCIDCDKVYDKEKKILLNIKKEAQEKDDFKKSVSENKYTCKYCNEEKLGIEMKLHLARKQVANMCKKCDTKRRYQYELNQITQDDFKIR